MSIRLALALLGSVLLAGPASAVTLTDVRIGVHGDHTRIVLETDAKAPYIVDAGEKEIIVHVDAAATAEAVTAKSPHLIWAKIEPTQIGADVRLSLKQPSDVKAMVLTAPHRIVLDLYPRKGGTAAAAPLPPPELLTEEEPEPAVAAEPAPMAAEEPGVATEPQVAEEPELLAEAGAEPAEPQAGAEAGLAEVEPTGEAPEGELAPGGVEELAGAPEPLTQPSDAPAAEAMAAHAPKPVAERPTTPLAPAPSRNLFGSPYLLAGIAAVLLVVFVFLRRRLRSAEQAARPSRDEPPSPFGAAQRAVAVGGTSASGESLFDVEAEAIGPPPKDDDALPALHRANVETGDENERRIAHLERRIEELVDARERLERQVAAQTEELRVQRAAIARTQRVLRTVAPRGEDEPSSDVVKG